MNYQPYIDKLKPSLNKLLLSLQKQGIEFVENDGNENVILKTKDKELKIWFHCFYRVSGIACIHREVGESFVEMIDMDDDMYMNSYMKAIVERVLINKKK